MASYPEFQDWLARSLDPLPDQPPAPGWAPDSAEIVGAPPAGDLTAAAVLVALVQRDDGYGVLLTKRSETMRRHTGQVALPGGRCDPGETFAQTALREAWEEIGLEPSFVTPLGLSTPCRTGTGYLITPVVGLVRQGFELSPNPTEVAEIFETPFGFLMDPSNHEASEREYAGQLRRVYAFTHDSRYIWGATAAILMALYNRLYGASLD